MLRMQLHVLSANFPVDECSDIHSIIMFFKQSSASQRELMSEVCSLVAHILVMPATNTISERSFTSLRRVKDYLRSENRLNSVMLLHIHKEKNDSLSLISIANDFLQGSGHRQTVFGTFTDSDV